MSPNSACQYGRSIAHGPVRLEAVLPIRWIAATRRALLDKPAVAPGELRPVLSCR